jgi:hypothetical protein
MAPSIVVEESVETEKEAVPAADATVKKEEA